MGRKTHEEGKEWILRALREKTVGFHHFIGSFADFVAAVFGIDDHRRCSDGGNPFFLQKRPGKKDKNGRERIFHLVKFRTMNNKRDQSGALLPDSQRLTKYGLFLRKTSLDELPELFNILCGSLSICGPRPLLITYLPYFTDEERCRHDVRPGLTGWAQVHGRNSVSWERRFRYDIEYVDNVSFKMDMKILWMTVLSVLSAANIAEDTRITEGNFAEIRQAQIKKQQGA